MDIEKLNQLSEKRIKYFLKNWDSMTWYKWSKSYWEYLEKEIQEAKDELNTHQVYLEDELGDVLWDYLCLLNSLKAEWKISSVEKVLERAFKKYSERIDIKTWEYNGKWEDVKQKQKEKIENEIKNFKN